MSINFNKGFDAELMLYEIINEKMPFNKLIGFKIHKIEPNMLSIKFNMKKELIGNYYYNILHGGVISAALDLVGGFTAFWSLLNKFEELKTVDKMERLSKLGTIDLRVDYLIPGKGEYFIAKGIILRLGNKVAVSRMELFNNNNQLIALGTGTYNVG
jgi:uncharacterized protein (TIGR00369 family)